MFDWLFGGKKEDNNNEKNEQVENNEGLDLEDLQLDISTDSTTESNSDEGIVLKEENNLDQGSLMVGGVEDLESTLELQNSQPQAEVIPTEATPTQQEATPTQEEATPAAQPQVEEYEIQKGDTLWKIAEKFYGDGNMYHKIVEDNSDVIKDPNKIYPGQKIKIYLA